MRHPAQTRVPSRAIARMTRSTRIAGVSFGTRLLPKPADIVDQLIDLTVREFLLERRHLAFAVADGVIDAFVRNAVLPFRARQIAGVLMFSVERSGAPVFAVTARAFAVENGGRFKRVG